MILSTHTEILPKKFGYEETVKLYAKTGFDAYDATFFDMKEPNFYFEENYREKALNLRKTADENNILCNQAHLSPCIGTATRRGIKKCSVTPKEALKFRRF